MSHSFLPVNPCCTDVVLNSPCGCSSTLPNTGCEQNPCGTNVILSSNVLYNGPVLDCIIAEPCDTLNVILQKIDEIICNLLTQINTLNIQVTNITTQIININSNIVNINNTLATCCAGVTTTTTSTTLCPCTYHQYVSVAQFPGTFTYVECDTLQPITVTAGGEVDTVCVDNNYPTIEIGKINVLNTGVCCSVITTTTTTTVFIQSYCNQITATGTVYIYWTDGNGDAQVMKIKDETVYICAQVGSIAFTGTGSISIIGSATTCITDGECAPVTTTTTTTTEELPCTSYLIEASGPSTFPGDTDWEAVECKTNISVGGTVVYPNIVDTGCIITGSLLLGPKLIIVDSEPCPTTTTTTTLFPPPSTTTTTTLFPPSTTTTTTTIAPCVEWTWEALGANVSNLEYIDCDGLLVEIKAVDVTNNSGIICVYPNTTPIWDPSPTTGYHNISTVGINCPTTTTTTTFVPCTIWSWEAVGFNISGIKYINCDGEDVYIDVDDVTNNSGDICVYPGDTPVWSPVSPGGTHILDTLGDECVTPTTTTTTTSGDPITIYTYALTCNSYTWSVTGDTYFDSDEISYTEGNVTNILILTICSGTGNQSYVQTVTAVSSYIWPINAQTYTESGSYAVTIGPCADGGASCEYTLELTIIEPTTTTTTIPPTTTTTTTAI
jgi:hypothetical protein